MPVIACVLSLHLCALLPEWLLVLGWSLVCITGHFPLPVCPEACLHPSPSSPALLSVRLHIYTQALRVRCSAQAEVTLSPHSWAHPEFPAVAKCRLVFPLDMCSSALSDSLLTLISSQYFQTEMRTQTSDVPILADITFYSEFFQEARVQVQ